MACFALAFLVSVEDRRKLRNVNNTHNNSDGNNNNHSTAFFFFLSSLSYSSFLFWHPVFVIALIVDVYLNVYGVIPLILRCSVANKQAGYHGRGSSPHLCSLTYTVY